MQKNKEFATTFSEDRTKQRRLYVFLGKDLSKLFVGRNAKWQDQASSLFGTLVEAAFNSSVLRSNLRDFYVRHTDFFEHDKTTGVRMSLEVSELTTGFANTLSFNVLGKGNISKLFRVITIYHAVQEGLLDTPKLSKPASISAARKALGQHNKGKLVPALPDVYQNKYKTPISVKALYTISRDTDEQINCLMIRLQAKKMALIRDLIERASRKTETAKIKAFFEESDDDFEVSGSDIISMRLNLPTEIDALHHLLAMRMFDSGRKKSKVLRIIVAYYAKQYGVDTIQ